MSQQVSIALEGIDGAGKSTVLEAVFTLLGQRGFDVAAFKYTGRRSDLCGRIIKRLYRSQELEFPLSVISKNRPLQELLFAHQARRNLVDFQRRNCSEVLLYDRSAITGFAYNGQIFGRNRVSELFVSIAESGLVPDYVLYLDVNPLIALDRIQARREGNTHDERLDVLTQTVANYQALVTGNWKPHAIRHIKWFQINGELPPDQVAKQATEIVLTIMHSEASDDSDKA